MPPTPSPSTSVPLSGSPPAPSPLRELALDVGLPLGLYFGLRSGAGVPLVEALTISSLPPGLRTLLALRRNGRPSPLALLMLAVNLAGIATTLITGDARLMFARNSLLSSVIALGMLVSVYRGRPLMSEGLRAFWARDGERAAAWDRLSGTCAPFVTLERRYTLVWGLCLLADCVARLVGALALPVATMAWASDAIIAGAIVLAVIVSGAVAAGRMERMIDNEVSSARLMPLPALGDDLLK